MVWNLINHIAMYVAAVPFVALGSSSMSCRVLVRDIVYWPQWTFAAKKANTAGQNSTINKRPNETHTFESLSNILLTHIDFRRPSLDYRRTNVSKDDETLDRTPVSCIEEFNLYVSTWKGWLGPLPSKDNSITWEQVERENTLQNSISCTHVVKPKPESVYDPHGNYTDEMNYTTTIPTPPPPPAAESFSYVIHKIPKSNLMLLYVNHSKETSQLCEKLVIRRAPVKFTQDDVCTRLKTTPYRERPQKCFFVHDNEKNLFQKCSIASRSVGIPLFTYLASLVILSCCRRRT